MIASTGASSSLHLHVRTPVRAAREKEVCRLVKVETSRDNLPSSHESLQGDTAVSNGNALLALMSFQICSFKCSAQGIFVTAKHMVRKKHWIFIIYISHRLQCFQDEKFSIQNILGSIPVSCR